ncbi:MFS transporter [Natronomonas sp. EA1]|uniref:MFS transporter n=1 Tax=Natronomonas sp. EA1 TaxID=3421655 RepID=UPI003EB8E167
MSESERPSARALLRRTLALERDVLVLSAAMFAFSLGFQATGRYMPRYLSILGASGLAVGLYGSLGNLLGAVYPYPGGALSDRIGSRRALTLFGLASTLGFLVWLAAPAFGTVSLPLAGTVPIGIFLGLLLVQSWKSLGLGATFAVVKQAVPPERLAAGFAATETVRRLAFLLGPLFAAAAIGAFVFETGFRLVLAGAAVAALVGTVAQHVLYTPSDRLGKSFAGVASVVEDLRSLPEELPPLLAGDTLVRFGNGMVHVFVVLVVTEAKPVSATLPVVGTLSPDAFFGVLLAVEMAVALVSMVPVARLADAWGQKPVVALGFLVYATFPALLVLAPASAGVYLALFAFSGLRFAGLPAHKALIVGPARANEGGRVTGSYYLARNTIVIPSAALGGVLYELSPTLAFSTATVVGLLGVVVFAVFGKRFET